MMDSDFNAIETPWWLRPVAHPGFNQLICGTDMRAGDIVVIKNRACCFERAPTQENPCTPDSLVCVKTARAGEPCHCVVNGPMSNE